jgi:hypothetical protein
MCRLLSRTKAIRTSGNHEEFLQRLQQSEWHVSDDIVSVESDPRCPPPIVLASSPIFLFFFTYPCPFSDIYHPNSSHPDSSHLLHIYSTSAPFIDVLIITSLPSTMLSTPVLFTRHAFFPLLRPIGSFLIGSNDSRIPRSVFQLGIPTRFSFRSLLHLDL